MRPGLSCRVAPCRIVPCVVGWSTSCRRRRTLFCAGLLHYHVELITKVCVYPIIQRWSKVTNSTLTHAPANAATWRRASRLCPSKKACLALPLAWREMVGEVVRGCVGAACRPLSGQYLRLHIRGWKVGTTTVACSLRTANDERGHHTPMSHTHTPSHSRRDRHDKRMQSI